MADTFDVWGKPRKDILAKLTHSQQNALRKYVEGVVSQCYQIAYDNGHVEGLTAVMSLANQRLKNRMLAGAKRRSR